MHADHGLGHASPHANEAPEGHEAAAQVARRDAKTHVAHSTKPLRGPSSCSEVEWPRSTAHEARRHMNAEAPGRKPQRCVAPRPNWWPSVASSSEATRAFQDPWSLTLFHMFHESSARFRASQRNKDGATQSGSSHSIRALGGVFGASFELLACSLVCCAALLAGSRGAMLCCL